MARITLPGGVPGMLGPLVQSPDTRTAPQRLGRGASAWAVYTRRRLLHV